MFNAAYLIGVLFGAIVMGFIVGLIPLICGLIKKRILLAIGGFFACIVAHFILGFFFSVPVCAAFTILIFVTKKKR